MLWLGGFLSLDLMTGTPDALCPPLEEARAAVKARVGEVQGDYHADFSLVRADDGQPRLDLTLREGTKEVLKRELPIDTAACQDAAQTIALVLERYFDAIERPVVGHSTGEEVAPAPGRRESSSPPRSQSPSKPATWEGRRPLPVRHPVGIDARAGTLVDRELGIAAVVGMSFFPHSFRITPRFRLGLGLEAAPFFARQTDAKRDKQVEAFVVQSALFVPLESSWSRWSASVGPWAQLRLQRASMAIADGEDPRYRAIPGLGAFIRVGLDLAENIGLGAGLAAGRQLRGETPRFVLDGGAGQIAVLVPDAWFGHGQLTFELKL